MAHTDTAATLADRLAPYRVTRRPVPAPQRRLARALRWARLQRKARGSK